MNDIANSPQSYLDFAGLGNLRGQAAQKSGKATRETATQFEAMFIQMMMKSMRQATEKSDLMGSDAGNTFEEMYDRELSVKLAKRNVMGVADMLVKNIELAETAAEQARARAGNTEPPQAMPLQPAKEAFAMPREQQPVPLIRPEKFNIKLNVNGQLQKESVK